MHHDAQDCEVQLNLLRQCHVLPLYLRLQPLQHHKHHAHWQGCITLVQLDNWIANSCEEGSSCRCDVGTTLAQVSITRKRVARSRALLIVDLGN